MTDTEAISRCIRGVVRAKDGRGVYQSTNALRVRLELNTTPTIARMCAEAAQAVGESIARRAA